MKRIASIFFLMILCGVSFVQAQEEGDEEPKNKFFQKDKLLPHFGFMFQLYFIDTVSFENPIPALPRPGFYSIGVGTYYAIGHKNDVVSYGLDLNLHAGMNISEIRKIDFVIQTPIFLMGRVGAGSTSYNQQRMGLGVGVGATYSFFSYSDRFTSQFRRHIVNPSVLVEGSFNSSGGPIIGRIMFSALPHKQMIDNPPSPAFQAKFGFLSFGLVYGF